MEQSPLRCELNVAELNPPPGPPSCLNSEASGHGTCHATVRSLAPSAGDWHAAAQTGRTIRRPTGVPRGAGSNLCSLMPGFTGNSTGSGRAATGGPEFYRRTVLVG
eukprot:748043-Hanusia_phi.AAC.2